MEFETKTELLKKQSEKLFGIDEKLLSSVRYVFRTSGTTGTPLLVPMNEKDIEVTTEIGSKCFRNAGVKDGMRIIHCLNYRMWTGGVIDSLSLRRAGACVFNFGVGGTEELIEMIIRCKIEGISCTPSYMTKIEEILNKKFGMDPKDLGIKLLLFGGESGVQNPEFRNKIESKWNAIVIDANYGSADSMSMFASENYITKDGLRFFGKPYVIPKLIDPVTEEEIPIKTGSTGSLVISINYEGGLIKRHNYQMNDMITILSDEPEFRFKIIGRSDEMIVIRGLNVYPDAIRKIITNAEYEFDCKIVGQLRVSEKDPIEEVQFRFNSTKHTEALGSYLTSEFMNNIHVRVRLVPEHIENLISANGKVKLIKRCL